MFVADSAPMLVHRPENFGKATKRPQFHVFGSAPYSPLRSWPWLPPRTLAPPWPVRCGTLGLNWRTSSFTALNKSQVRGEN